MYIYIYIHIHSLFGKAALSLAASFCFVLPGLSGKKQIASLTSAPRSEASEGEEEVRLEVAVQRNRGSAFRLGPTDASVPCRLVCRETDGFHWIRWAFISLTRAIYLVKRTPVPVQRRNGCAD